MHDVVDLRSDTLTKPTPAMRAAMAAAEVGDDVWEEDPTVQRLEARAAERFGKEAGLFVASGTMGNQVAVLTHTRPGQEVIATAMRTGLSPASRRRPISRSTSACHASGPSWSCSGPGSPHGKAQVTKPRGSRR